MKVEYFDLKDKRALVSGGASGIGASIVEHLCEQGVEVYFFDIDTSKPSPLSFFKTRKLLQENNFVRFGFFFFGFRNLGA